MNRKRLTHSDPNGPFLGALIPEGDDAIIGLATRISRSCRAIRPEDSGAVGVPAILVSYANQGAEHRRVKSIAIAAIDVGSASEHYADIWVRSSSVLWGVGAREAPYAIRVSASSGKAYVLNGE